MEYPLGYIELKWNYTKLYSSHPGWPICGIDKQGRVLVRITRLAQGNPGDVKPVGNGVSELRLTYGPGYRIYYFKRNEELIILLVGGSKSTQKKDIESAHGLAKEISEQK